MQICLDDCGLSPIYVLISKVLESNILLTSITRPKAQNTRICVRLRLWAENLTSALNATRYAKQLTTFEIKMKTFTTICRFSFASNGICYSKNFRRVTLFWDKIQLKRDARIQIWRLKSHISRRRGGSSGRDRSIMTNKQLTFFRAEEKTNS